jgi:multidrug resistance protein, MATE family
VLANAAVPLLGLADTAVIGNAGTVADLGGIALGALVFSFAFWGFGFLRMGTTGFVAQAAGRGDSAEVRATVARGLLLAVTLGVLLLLLQRPIVWTALRLLGASAEVERLTAQYIAVRIWAAPASLSLFAVLGALIGLGRTRHVLLVQLVLNGVNIALDVLFAGVWHQGVRGIALGTLLAEWLAALLGVWLLLRVLNETRTDAESFWPVPRIRDVRQARALLGANADIMIRTLFLLLGFGWFANTGAAFGPVMLAANHVLLQLISLSAYLLDGYAHATEILVGRAVGEGALASFNEVVRRSTMLAGASAVVLALLAWWFGPWAIAHLTDLGDVRKAAGAYLPYTVVYIALAFAAFQLDGVFIGATATRPMRNASVLSCLAFIALSIAGTRFGGNAGLWLAFIAFVVLRAVALAVHLPSLQASMATAERASPAVARGRGA